VPADGFYEWKKIEGQKRKQPYYIHMHDRRPFAFAGLWEHWEGADGSEIDSCTIITTEPNELMQSLHNRMPVILQPIDYAKWLDPELQKPDRLEALLIPYHGDDLACCPVSKAVNNPSYDAPTCIAPLRD
jgi:putative SOS response-associated peptidase YedK